MVTPKTLLCRCEDVTLDECSEAVTGGYSCFEDLKRFLGVGTGPCQGKSCVQAAMHLIAGARAIPVGDVDVMTFRPPVRPISFATLAAPDAVLADAGRSQTPQTSQTVRTPVERSQGESAMSATVRNQPSKQAVPAVAPPGSGPKKSHYHVVILGGGAVGLSIAHHLAKLGITDVLVIDKDSLVKGATGRNGGGVRAQWTSVENIVLAKRSIEAFKHFAQETGHNTFFRQGGYLFLTRSEAQLAALTKAAAFQNQHGVRTKVISLDKARRIVPGLNTNGCVGATFNPDDAVLFPWPLVWGYKEAAERRGVEVATFTGVEGLEVSGGKVVAIQTNRGRIGCGWVVNAVGAWSPAVAKWVGIDLPVKPERHEILVTEPLKPMLDPMLVDLSTGYYLNQDMRGELVGGLGTHTEESMDWASSLDFMRAFAKETVRLLPRLGPVRVLRQWAG